MDKNLIVHVVGARPNFIKLSAVYTALKRFFNQLIVHTGQHYDYELSRVFFKELNIPEPNYDLNVGSGPHGYQTGEILKRVEEVLLKEKPRMVMVYGDTNSTLAGALASVKLGIRVAHVEAGVRSYEKHMAEEINRVIVDRISDLLFAPTERAVKNLRKEGIVEGVYFTGDVMLDLFLSFRNRFNVRDEDFILVTVHRAENTDDPKRLKTILEALAESGEEVVFPMHPRTRKRAMEYGFEQFLKAENIKVTKPMGYLEFLDAMSRARIVATDSGGVQKEAYFMGKPCVTLRESTEWVETVESGWNVLVGVDKERILNTLKEFKPRGKPDLSLFGDGGASRRIASILSERLNG
ncbi:MAG: UDP-N-acetylglucosamine 2-epimerase (non-hydrolyzing) [Candidatus Bathyarchaeia archaeon]